MITERQQMPAPINKAIHEFNSKLEKRIYWVIMNQIKKSFGIQQDLFDNKLWFNVPTVLIDTNYDRLKAAADGLSKSRIRMINDKEEEFHIITPFPEIVYTKRSGIMKVRLLDTAFNHFSNITKGYYWFALKGALTLSSMYSQRLYELFCEALSLKHGVWKNVDIIHLKKLLNVDDSAYKRNGDLLINTVYDPIKEINEKTNLCITYNPKKEGRKIVGFDFFIKEQEPTGEVKEYEKIEKYFEEFKALPGQEKSNIMLDLKTRYNLSDNIFNEIMINKGLMNEVLGAHEKINEGKVYIKTSETQYIHGVINKYKEKNIS